MKRFWQQARHERRAEGFVILLDGKPMRLPGGETLPLTEETLAAAIAGEWDALTGTVTPDALPLTQLAATAALRIAPDPGPTAETIARYGESDLLCYRADTPPELKRRQAEAWQPWLDWAGRRYDAWLLVTEGIGHLAQPPEALQALAAAVRRQSPAGLAALGIMVPILGSLVLGLAIAEGALAPEEAYRLSVLDALFQEERWGQDSDAAAGRARAARDTRAAAHFLTLTR